MNEEMCPQCGGSGADGVRAEHGCDGTEEMCARTCPVPVQEMCSCCGGGGTVQTPIE